MLGSPLIGWVGKRLPGLSRNLEQSRARLSRRAVMAVAVVRLTPGLLQVPSLVAGVMRLPYMRFFAGVAISSLLYDLAFILLGFLSRIGLQNVSEEVKIYVLIGVIVVIAAVVLFLGFRRSIRQ